MPTLISEASVSPREAIIERLYDEGFDVVSVTTPDAIQYVDKGLRDFIAQGRHGDMGWLEDRANWRANPKVLWPDVASVIMVGMNYGPDHDPMKNLENTEVGNISVYARNRDYHDVMKKKLKRVGRWMAQAHQAQLKVFVDTAPVAEKPLAQAAGLGWQGKHTNLVSRDHGSWLFLGAIFTDMVLVPDAPETDHCGSCQNCLDICPTNAFPAPYQLDARRCISYLTIEHKGPIPAEFRVAMGNRIYGCDDCLAVCPWNKYAAVAREVKLQPRDDLAAPSLIELSKLDDPSFRTLFSGSPIKRIGRDRFIRNVLIALGNSGDRNAIAALEDRLADASPLVRGMAVWSLKRLAPSDRLQALQHQHLPAESDPAVQAEWTS